MYIAENLRHINCYIYGDVTMTKGGGGNTSSSRQIAFNGPQGVSDSPLSVWPVNYLIGILILF